jgi:hypothetical protein
VTSQTSKDEYSLSRYSRDWRKDNVLTWGGLPDHEMVQEKSADAIVGTGNELSERGRGLIRCRRAER